MSISCIHLLKAVCYLMLNMWKWPARREWCCIDRDGGKAAGSQPLCSASLQLGREASMDTHKCVHTHSRADVEMHTHAWTHWQAHTCANEPTVTLSHALFSTNTHTHTHTECSRWGASTSQRCHFSVSCSGRSALTFYEALCRNQQLVMAAGLSLLSTPHTPSISFPQDFIFFISII